jgi:hypothetical protein
MTINSTGPQTIDTKSTDMPGSGKFTGDQTALLEGFSTYIHGVGYPAMKDDILKQAQINGADPNVLNSIKKVSARHYTSRDDILKEFSKNL